LQIAAGKIDNVGLILMKVAMCIVGETTI